MAMPPGGNWLIGGLKDSLLRDGWILTVDVGQDISGTTSPNTDLKVRPSSPARYRLRGGARQVGYCIVGRPKLAYDISIIDMKSSQEILTVAGMDDCLGADPVVRVMAAVKAAGG